MPLTTSRLLAMLGLVLGLALGGLALWQHRAATQSPQAAARPTSVIQGPQPRPAQVTLPDGRRLTCAQGAEPAVSLQGASFSPPLVAGSWFRAGVTYRVRATGTLVNETDLPIRVGRVTATLQGRAWRATVRHRAALAAEASVPLEIRGTFRSTRRERARLETHLRWRWRDPDYRACGDRGLVEDD